MRAIKLMADYKCYPLWEVGNTVGDINPNDLQISESLKSDLLRWAKLFDQTLNEEYPPDSRFSSAAAENEFRQEGIRLTERLNNELTPLISVEVKF